MRLTSLAMLPALLLGAQPVTASGFFDPAAIDTAVAAFTGAQVGEPGGARLPVDRRLRLAPCPAAPGIDWYGTRRDTVIVQCPGSAGWRIFVPVNAAWQGAGGQFSGGQFSGGQGRQVPAVKRGDTVTMAIRGRGFVLSRQAQAVDGGAIGEWIRVRPMGGGEQMRASILHPGAVGMDLP